MIGSLFQTWQVLFQLMIKYNVVEIIFGTLVLVVSLQSQGTSYDIE